MRRTMFVEDRAERNRVDRENMIQECKNSIVEDNFHEFLHRNCEGTEQLRKIIFSDLDGTLLCDDKSISIGNRQAIEAATKAGHSFVIATGRPFESARMVSDSLGLNGEGCYIVSYNGGHVYDCYHKKVLFSRQINMQTVHELFALADEAGLYVHTYQNGEILTKAQTKELEWYAKRTNLKPSPRPDVLDYLTREPNKAIVINIDDHERLERFRIEHEAWSKGRCRMLFSCPQYLEVVPEGISKQTGISFLAEYIGVSVTDTIAVGDETNDIEMIKVAGVGVAVSNANPAAKEAADYVTERNNNEDAIAEVIQRFVFGTEG